MSNRLYFSLARNSYKQIFLSKKCIKTKDYVIKSILDIDAAKLDYRKNWVQKVEV